MDFAQSEKWKKKTTLLSQVPSLAAPVKAMLLLRGCPALL